MHFCARPWGWVRKWREGVDTESQCWCLGEEMCVCEIRSVFKLGIKSDCSRLCCGVNVDLTSEISNLWKCGETRECSWLKIWLKGADIVAAHDRVWAKFTQKLRSSKAFILELSLFARLFVWCRNKWTPNEERTYKLTRSKRLKFVTENRENRHWLLLNCESAILWSFMTIKSIIRSLRICVKFKLNEIPPT